ncbi:MAG: aminotransferase class I and II [Bacteroides sp.]|nr:aminotransferase class I and II [Bacteroidales bacterium]MBD5305390.1 aminotransferase class I and II [Bacteroides sp.]MBD5347869.1 aminotransferase class I and II [Bacteroides sp.]
MEIRKEELTRYILPLREGGSLPALAEAGDGFKYVVKLAGAGHGKKALISEFVGGLVAKAFKFNVPEIVLLNLDGAFGITEPDEEVQELLRKSEGLNMGLHFLAGAATFDGSVNKVDELTASKIVWLDAFLTNVDRTRLNPNMMIWNNELWLIDHGASLYFHHSWKNPEEASKDPFPYIKTHALLPFAGRLEEADKLMRQAITPRTLSKIVDMIPTEWLEEENSDISPADRREVYRTFLLNRLKNSSIFTREAIKQRQLLLQNPLT